MEYIVYKTVTVFVLFPSRLRIKCLYLEIKEKTLTSGLPLQVIFLWCKSNDSGTVIDDKGVKQIPYIRHNTISRV